MPVLLTPPYITAQKPVIFKENKQISKNKTRIIIPQLISLYLL